MSLFLPRYLFPGVTLFDGRQRGEPMFGLTVKQPFGSAIVNGPKRIENRPWRPWPRLCNGAFWIVVHAGAGLYDGAERRDFAEPRLNPWTNAMEGAMWRDCPELDTLPRRVVLGAARVIGCARIERAEEANRLLGPWAFGAECWLLDPTVIRLPKPVPMELGALSLWPLIPEKGARPERTAPEVWTRRIDQGRAAVAALREARNDPAQWRWQPAAHAKEVRR